MHSIDAVYTSEKVVGRSLAHTLCEAECAEVIVHCKLIYGEDVIEGILWLYQSIP